MFEKLKRLFSKKNKNVDKNQIVNNEIEPTNEKIEKEIVHLTPEERRIIANIRIERFKPDPLLEKINREYKKRDEEEKRDIEKRANKDYREPTITAVDWQAD